ncbi:MAG: serine hydrolase [Bacteroidales bacterium]|jgi:beta-glucosidase-like glycosyl hydrolase/CubicO group peptidase (beta-lactamase class C family)|nr:serine hydrolase [Bacteroidales bacterium]
MKKTLITLFLLILSLGILADNPPIKKQKGRIKYVNSLMSKMTTKQMVGQMIMIASDSKTSDSNYVNSILKQIDSFQVGGVCFFKGTQKEMLTLNELYNNHSPIPLMISIDGEWGLNMRLTDAVSFPMQMTLGALPTNKYSLVYDMGKNIAKQCKEMGIDIDFAPDIDINLNPNNPVINMRSFGEDKYKVALLGNEYMQGLQDGGVMAVIKHFPGHGDTETDSHKATPTISHTKSFIDSVDSYPFKYNINKNAWGVLVGHLAVPSLSKDSSLPASINEDIINKYLIDSLNFKGLVFTDAMNMKGLTNVYGNGEAEVRAVEAGIDIILMPNNTDKAINAIMVAIDSGRINESLIKAKCKKILLWKYDMGILTKKRSYILPDKQTIEQADKINKDIAQNIITSVMVNDVDFPIANNQDTIILFETGTTDYARFNDEIKRYNNNVIIKHINKDSSSSIIDSTLKNYSATNNKTKIFTLIAGGCFAKSSSKYGIPSGSLNTLQYVNQKTSNNNIAIFFANSYVLKYIDTSLHNKSLFAYQNTAYTQQAMAYSLFSSNKPMGVLPVSAGTFSIEESPIITSSINYSSIMSNNMDVNCFKQIDSIANEGVQNKIYPGCQVLIAKDGNIVLNNSYGSLSYDDKTKVYNNTIYDIASVSKVLSTTLCVMKLYEQGKISLDDNISKYLPYLKHNKKGKLTIKDLLSHNTILPATYPFWKKALDKGNMYAFNKENDNDYVQVCDSLYIRKSFKEDIRNMIAKDVPCEKEKHYVYSDLNFFLLADMVEKVSGTTIDKYVEENFYNPMKLNHTYFNPLQKDKTLKNNIAPTEDDNIFRKMQIRGYVHDPLCAVCGGVCGNAGVFSNSEDVFKICQMLLNGGVYDNVRYLDSSTISTFNTRYFKDKNIRRALGFDKPFISSESSHCSKYCSQQSFGHSGFTGTLIWIDPENHTVFVFLSNRVCPNASPNKLASSNIRTKIQDLIYKSLEPQD